ncbi:alpha-amylase 2-like, partial [Aphomia sociella]
MAPKTFYVQKYMLIPTVLALLIRVGLAVCDDHGTNQLPDRSTIVHLFEWKWKDIAEECERFLAPYGFGGVQISPPSENLIIHLQDGTRTWYERYQVMSYKLITRSGNAEDFLNMTRRCNKVGVRIYADVVVNHMTGDNPNNIGTGGSTADFKKYSYPAVPYRQEDFHFPYCIINNYNNATEVRACNLVGLKDLNHDSVHVQSKISDFLNELTSLGVAGF